MPAIFLLLLQVLFTLGAGWLLWKTWWRLSVAGPGVGVLIGAGLVIRALLAQAIFWISYLHLPIARSLQLGDGFWALAIDGRLYSEYASDLLDHGWSAVVLIDKTLPSPAFLQILALFQLLFGRAASVGSLLNLFAYLGACAVILRLGRVAGGGVATPARIAIAAISFAPAVIIWSVQPLKDAFFISAVAAFVASCTLWQEAWRERFSARRFLLTLLLMLISFYAVAGIRWYFGLLFWGASAPYFAVAAWRSNRRALAAVLNAVLFLALSQVIVFAARPYVPRQLLISFRHDSRDSPRTIAETVVQSRKSFDTVRVNTMIEAGTALQELDTSIDEPPLEIASSPLVPQPITPPSKTASPPVKAVTPAAPTQGPDSSPIPKPSVAQARKARDLVQASRAENKKVPASATTPAPAPALSREEPRDTTPAVTTQGPSEVQTAQVAKSNSAPAPASTQTAVSTTEAVLHQDATPGPRQAFEPAPSRKTMPKVRAAGEAKALHETPPSPVMKTAPNAAPPRSAAPAPPGAGNPPRLVRKRAAPYAGMPRSTFARITAGLTAVTLPRFVGERLGLIHVGGGRGLWSIVETDTLFFDGLLLVVFYYVFRALPRGAWRNPSFWLVVLSTAGITFLLSYTISNFGTLFRHRAMIFMGLCLLLVVARDPRLSAGPLQEDLIAES